MHLCLKDCFLDHPVGCSLVKIKQYTCPPVVYETSDPHRLDIPLQRTDETETYKILIQNTKPIKNLYLLSFQRLCL